jgi:hypothetical protein
VIAGDTSLTLPANWKRQMRHEFESKAEVEEHTGSMNCSHAAAASAGERFA